MSPDHRRSGHWSDEQWIDADAGPVARPYTVTGGRTQPRGEQYFDLVDMVVATSAYTASDRTVGPERRRIVELCRHPVTVADLASDIGLPLGVLRVLLSDLTYEGLMRVSKPAPRGRITDKQLLREVLEGLHSL